MAPPGISGGIADRLADHLAAELGDAGLAGTLARSLADQVLTFRAPERPVAGAALILAFTFGNRMLPSGNREPGPVNVALARIAAELCRETGAPVVAQWEVAEALPEALPPGISVTAIYPLRDSRGEPRYLGTQPTANEMRRLSGTAAPVLVVAFADHLWRAVTAARRSGFDAWAPAGVAMPSEYDPESGQAWCRSRPAYLLHDLMLRLADLRDQAVGAPWG